LKIEPPGNAEIMSLIGPDDRASSAVVGGDLLCSKLDVTLSHGLSASKRRLSDQAPLHNQQMNLPQVLGEEVHDMAGSIRAERPTPNGSVGVALVVRGAVPRSQLERAQHVDIAGECLDR
jgi:hypothetical protein